MATLDFSQYIGGADNIQVEIAFPSTQKTVVYNFGTNITGWNFHLDYQTVVADTISYNVSTGAPNFAGTKLIGTFPVGNINTGTYVQVLDPSTGTVAITLPGGLYNGPIIPDARSHTPITVVGVTWTDNGTPPQINTHRWAILQAWEPGVISGDPTLAENYAPVIVGA